MTLLIVDGNAVLHRAYHAMPDWRNRSGEATAGVYGFLSMLFKGIEELKPSHLAIVFDCPEPTFRHTMYVGYQTNREKDRQVSEDIWGQVAKLETVFAKMNVPVYRVPGFEADDVIGSISRQAAEKGHKSVIITGDRDLMQLVTDDISLYMPIRGMTDMMLVTANKVKERLGVRPDQVIDYKGLVGDSSDNYPGVAGVGPKTATDLLAKYDTLENIYAHLGELPEKVALKLANGHEAAILSQQLATIRQDAPVAWDHEAGVVPPQEVAVAVLKELGYKSLIRRMTGEEVVIDDSQGRLFD